MCGSPEPADKSTGLKTLDSMTEKEFDDIMSQGFEEAIKGESIPAGKAFKMLLRDESLEMTGEDT